MLGSAINKIIAKKDLSYAEMQELFQKIIEDQDTAMNQGAFLAALTAKGATPEEIAAIRDVIYEADTNKVTINTDKPLVENSGTGMDNFKTFNISTGASIVAAACGAAVARHCSRAITSKCGAVDVAEALGIEVEAESNFIGRCVKKCGIGIFNGMSSKIHPSGLSRILSQINFGTVLNTAASLANPAQPLYGVRGVNDPKMIDSTAEIMKQIGYQHCMVLHGYIGEDSPAMDEASTLGKTTYIIIDENRKIEKNHFYPEDFGLKRSNPECLCSLNEPKEEAKRLIRILSGRQNNGAKDIVLLNAALILYTCRISSSIEAGLHQARNAIGNGDALKQLESWICTQTFLPDEIALQHFENLKKEALL